jgi:hypothetical protein
MLIKGRSGTAGLPDLAGTGIFLGAGAAGRLTGAGLLASGALFLPGAGLAAGFSANFARGFISGFFSGFLSVGFTGTVSYPFYKVTPIIQTFYWFE